MNARWLTRTGAPALVILFGGWALGPEPFVQLAGDQDLLFVDDYRHLDLPPPDRAPYETVTVLAYSFGVASALHWLDQTGFAPDHLVAVNGTPCPADPQMGIRPEVVRATAEGLSETSFARFCRRAGMTTPPQIDIPTRQDELFTILARGNARPRHFNRIWISAQDRIIPSTAQRRAWAAQPGQIREVNAPHMPFAPGQTWQEWLS
ncbi:MULTISPECIES: pimeloyl-ACP methyl esterase BioG family protein [unclassified Aliiroseovarius]|uniref:pimeloyl-ACP methyl esterase BioG family protein n=1 Tax=unclassified Aliiroseovarius TaxID=2623558 RepID=UPI001569E9A1|nr:MULTISPECIES: pimeloyl-ACP methyl esterase BioG family protein [unclassified Aliiroseovarius]NRP14344.1 hypothetical protein [Aliiroseovarius sp. xm-d-517]NRP42467.1 hypothetical protein [Aliiroseovarius sp. xm-m-339-2]NRP63341.1 hypothetical protein [Aliiroseovarius sp. xm-a-151]